MGLLFFGLIVVLVGVLSNKERSPIGRFKTIFIFGGIIIMGIGFLTAAVRQINAGHVGVQVLFGEVKSDILTEGLNLVNPLIDVREMSIQTQNYTMSSSYDEGSKIGDYAVRVLSKDGLEVVIDLTVLYRVIDVDAPRIYREIGLNFQDKIIRPMARTSIRESASYFEAIDLFAEKRDEFELRIRELIERDFRERGLMLEQLLIRNINLPASVKESIERKITAVQEAQRMRFVLEKEEQEADRKRVEAQGNADAQRIVAAALTDKVLQFEMIQVQKELVNSQNSKIILLGGSGRNTPPIIIGQ